MVMRLYRGNMIKRYEIVCQVVFGIIVVFSVVACSTMDLKDYPEAKEGVLTDTRKINGVSIVAQPLLDDEESQRYFGVDLTDKNILAVHVTIRNDDKYNSYLVFDDALHISQKKDIDIVNSPEKDSQIAADRAIATSFVLTPLLIADIFLQNDVLGVAGAVLLPLVAFSIQQNSDASIIKEKFEVNKFHTGTLDPGETMAGFTYFDLSEVESIDTPRLCIDILNSIENYEFPYCLDLSVDR